jgi:GTP-binding protein
MTKTLRASGRFVDRVRVLATAGDGGSGAVSIFRDSRVQRGGPDGGNGGHGGDVALVASHNVSDLRLPKKNFKASNGKPGMSADMHGQNGEPLDIPVPCGTVVHRLGTISASRTSRMEPPDAPQTFLGELLQDGDRLVVAKGGLRGRGNAAFRPGIQQHSRIAEAGGAGQAVTLLLSLKLIADVGLVGFPNAGKSSLLRALSNATPKVAPYPFTTIHPHLGRAGGPMPDDEFTVADIPGLVDGAHANVGLGHNFLRHVERTALLCYVLDLQSVQPPFEQLCSLRRELQFYQPGLEAQPSIVVANKADVPDASDRLHLLRAAIARLKASGGFPGLVGGEFPDAKSSRTSDAACGSVVTAVSALHAANLPTLVQRMRNGLAVGKRMQAAAAEKEQRAAMLRDAQAADDEWARKSEKRHANDMELVRKIRRSKK